MSPLVCFSACDREPRESYAIIDNVFVQEQEWIATPGDTWTTFPRQRSASLQERLYCSIEMLVRTIPINKGSRKPSAEINACAAPTTNMLSAFTKHFAKLSRYFKTNDTSNPQAAKAKIVPNAAPLNPSYKVLRPSSSCCQTETNPKMTPKK